MADLTVYPVFSTPLTKGAIIFGRSDKYTDVILVNPPKLFWDNTNYRLGIGTGSPNATLDVRGTVIFNDAGGDFDFRVEGDTDTALLFTDASTDRVGIGTSVPTAKLNVEGTVIFNDAGIATADVRMEGDTDANLFSLDASRDAIGIGILNPTVGYKMDINGIVALTTLMGQTQTQNADDTLYLGSATAGQVNFFIDRGLGGGQFIFGYNTARKTGTVADNEGIFTIFNDSTNHQTMFQCQGTGTTASQQEVIINNDQANIDFRWESDTNANGLVCDASNTNITINAASISDDYDLGLAGSGVLLLKETTTPTADVNYGKVYTKSDNFIYFQDGAGSEHKILHAGGIDISTDTNLAATSPIVLTNDTLSLDQSAVDHGSIGGLSDDDHTQYVLLAGRSGGQTVIGSTVTAEDLTLQDNAIDGNSITLTNIIAAYTHSQIAGGDSVHVSTTENTNWDAAYAHIHNLTTDIDHDQLTNFAAGEHFTMLDENDLASDSDTQAATQQSIKAYVDALDTSAQAIKWAELL